MAVETSFSGFLDIVRRHWRTFAAVGVMAAALSTLLSSPWFIKPLFRSYATAYPVNLNSYSTETRTDQLLQLLESNSIRDSLVREFRLDTVYRVDTTKAGWRFGLYNEFKDRVEITKTRYESVMIEVLDEHPERARDMVLAILEQANLLARRLQREKSQEVLRIAERAMAHERHKLDSVEARMDTLRKNAGLLSYDSQVKELTKGYVRLLTNPGAGGGRKDEILRMIGELEAKGGEFRQLTELGNMFRGNYDRLLSEYERAVNDVTKELTYTNTILYPEVPDKKAYPVRWLIVLTGTASALFLCFALLVWREYRSPQGAQRS